MVYLNCNWTYYVYEYKVYMEYGILRVGIVLFLRVCMFFHRNARKFIIVRQFISVCIICKKAFWMNILLEISMRCMCCRSFPLLAWHLKQVELQVPSEQRKWLTYRNPTYRQFCLDFLVPSLPSFLKKRSDLLQTYFYWSKPN